MAVMNSRMLHFLAALGMASGQPRLAVVRPFASPLEVAALSSSFDTWDRQQACSAPASSNTAYAVDLILVYSQKLSENQQAAAAAQAVQASFAAKNKNWQSCFQNLYVTAANLTAAQDIYVVSSFDGSARADNWVNGPNSVFRFVLGSFINGTLPQTYSSFFFMEMDCVPMRMNWLDQFANETNTSARYPLAAIRGSLYRGDKWNDFRPQMPASYLAHINGNAIYNVQHPFLVWLYKQLMADQNTVNNSVPFDLRMAELKLAAQQGVTQDLANVWSSYVAVGADPYRADSDLIGNFAGTLLNNSFTGGQFVQHRPYFSQIANLAANVTLAVADWSKNAAQRIGFNSSVGNIHPFRNILMLTTDPTMADRVEIRNTQMGTSTLTWRLSEEPSHVAFCELAMYVTTPYFVFTDSFHAISARVDILFKNNATIIPFIYANSTYCTSNQECLASLRQAKQLFGVDLPYHFDTNEVLFNTAAAQQFCDVWSDTKGFNATEDAGSWPSYINSCGTTFGPTADDFFAWNYNVTGSWAGTFAPMDKTLVGWRKWTKLHTLPPADTRTCALPSMNAANYSSLRFNATASACQLLANVQSCVSNANCSWDALFGACIDVYPVRFRQVSTTTTTSQVSSTSKAFLASTTSTAMPPVVSKVEGGLLIGIENCTDDPETVQSTLQEGLRASLHSKVNSTLQCASCSVVVDVNVSLNCGSQSGRRLASGSATAKYVITITHPAAAAASAGSPGVVQPDVASQIQAVTASLQSPDAVKLPEAVVNLTGATIKSISAKVTVLASKPVQPEDKTSMTRLVKPQALGLIIIGFTNYWSLF